MCERKRGNDIYPNKITCTQNLLDDANIFREEHTDNAFKTILQFNIQVYKILQLAIFNNYLSLLFLSFNEVVINY